MKIIFAEKSFKDSLSVLRGAPKSAGGTFHNFTGKPKPDRIDYIFLSSRFTPLNYRIISGKLNGSYPSDHYPVCSLLELKL